MASRFEVYLPAAFGSGPRWRLLGGKWSGFQPVANGWYESADTEIPAGREIQFQYKDPHGTMRPIAPVAGPVENLNGRFFTTGEVAPRKIEPGQKASAKVCLEVTLEGLLGCFEGGRHAPQDIQDLLGHSISERVVRAGIPGRLAGLGIDELMAPVFPAVADRTRLNPKFNYLVYTVGEVDWQIGTPSDFSKLVAAFEKEGIDLIPDMIFAHFVKDANAAGFDHLKDASGNPLFIDSFSYLFRDYGTWMYNLEDSGIRKVLVGKIVRFIETYRLRVIRIDYIDGIIQQYSNRTRNFGEIFLQELHEALASLPYKVLVIGEAFSTQGNPVVRSIIDVFYCPRGFSFAEELYHPPEHVGRSVMANVERMAYEIDSANDSVGREAVYAQLHDECWQDEHISAGRPAVPWAYGANPAELGRAVGKRLVELGRLAPCDVLDFVHRRVRCVESLTMFTARYRYIMTPAVDSLSLGRLDQSMRWRMEWGDPSPDDFRVWRKSGLSSAEIFRIHDLHRSEMKALRNIWRRLTPIDAALQRPLVTVRTLLYEKKVGVLVLLRRVPGQRKGAHIVVWNFGPHSFMEGLSFELAIPEDLTGAWKVIFDGGNFQRSVKLAPNSGSERNFTPSLTTAAGEFSGSPNTLRVEIGSHSMVILELEA